jgi:hypothetical protein
MPHVAPNTISCALTLLSTSPVQPPVSAFQSNLFTVRGSRAIRDQSSSPSQIPINVGSSPPSRPPLPAPIRS